MDDCLGAFACSVKCIVVAIDDVLCKPLLDFDDLAPARRPPREGFFRLNRGLVRRQHDINIITCVVSSTYRQYDSQRYAAFLLGDSMDRATEGRKLRELADDELSVVGGGSAIWGGVGGAFGGFLVGGPVGAVVGLLVVAYLFSPGKAG